MEWYRTADENGDGKLSVNEFFAWSLSSTRVGGSDILKQMFETYDTDKSGTSESATDPDPGLTLRALPDRRPTIESLAR